MSAHAAVIAGTVNPAEGTPLSAIACERHRQCRHSQSFPENGRILLCRASVPVTGSKVTAHHPVNTGRSFTSGRPSPASIPGASLYLLPRYRAPSPGLPRAKLLQGWLQILAGHWNAAVHVKRHVHVCSCPPLACDSHCCCACAHPHRDVRAPALPADPDLLAENVLILRPSAPVFSYAFQGRASPNSPEPVNGHSPA